MTLNSLFLIKTLIGFILLSVIASGSNWRQRQDKLHLNQIQIIGSHNSYKQAITPALMELILSYDPKAKGLEYRHLPIEEQLELGLRSFELDVLHDPEGGRYTHPKGIEMLHLQGKETKPIDTAELTIPGFKVLHVPDIDFRTHCGTFKGCLGIIDQWSAAHPDHLPIIITINPKTTGVEMPGFAKVLPFNKKVLDSLNQEIREVFSEERLIHPQLVQGNYSSLREAILNKGWPTLADAREKMLFVLDAGDQLTAQYLQLAAAERLMFVDVNKDHPQAAFFIMNNPVKQELEIRELVRQGFMIRTRSDANTREARNGDTSRFEAAVRSGAQVISTDYYLKTLSPNQDFEISFDNRQYNQCNPVLVDGKDCEL